MKRLAASFLSSLMLLLFVTVSVPFTGCKKTTTIYDTTIKTVYDTVVKTVHDTVIINDTVYYLSSGLVAHYNFNNGNLKDSSGYGNDIFFNNAIATTDRFGNANNAYLFNGTSSYMQIHNNIRLNPASITMFAIVKVNGFYQGNCHSNVIIMKGDNDYEAGLYSLRFNDSKACSELPDVSAEHFWSIYGDNPSTGASSSAYITTGQWYNVAFTYDGSTAKLYINGALQQSVDKPVSFTPNNNDLFLGKTENPTFPYYFNGVMDEVRIYNRALSAVEIGALNKLKN